MIGYLPYLWTLAAIAAILAELMRPSLIAIWFLPSAAIAVILAFAGFPEWIQTLFFFGFYGLLLLMSRTLFRLLCGLHRK